MLEIFICEDDPTQRKNLTQVVENFIIGQGLDMKVALSTENPDQVLMAVKENPMPRFYFLDVELGRECTGIDLAVKVREYDPTGFIVFVTTHDQYTPLTFKYRVSALDYIPKGNFSELAERARECLMDAYNRHQQGSPQKKFLRVTDKDQEYVVDYDDVMFFGYDLTERKITLHSNQRREKAIHFSGNLKDLEGLDPRFYRIHKSFVVNVDRIQRVDRTTNVVYMENGLKCNVSLRKVKALLAYMADR
ncbi:MAG: LytTR family DNA-binding domain-containing protein [Turicibacter sp.]|nr:LytTR family DNA-binding domain-containing protein [Turicibacter sp.]